MTERLPLLVLLFSLAAAPLVAQTSDSSGAYTEEQAARGEATFRRVCAACHVGGQFSGDAFRRTWEGRSSLELFELIRTTMPNDNPGRLPRRSYADVVAWILKQNGAPAGASELAAEPDSLRRVPVITAVHTRNR